MKFTIALPVRNGGDYLKQCVASILAQTFDGFDLTVLDNCSTDGTTEWLRELGDARITVMEAAVPLSIEENWARILTIQKNEFITTIGHDDLLDPNFLEIITQLIDRHPRAGLYLTHFRLIDEKGTMIRHCPPMPAQETAAEFLSARLCGFRLSYGTGHVMRARVYDEVGGIPPFPQLLYADDALFLRVIGSSYRATAFEEAFSYRFHATSAANEASMAQFFDGLERYADLLSELARTDAATSETLRRYFSDYAVIVGKLYFHECLKGASRSRCAVDPNVRHRIEQLASHFGPMSRWDTDISTRLLERAGNSTVHRMAYDAWRMQRKLRQATKNWAVELLAGTRH